MKVVIIYQSVTVWKYVAKKLTVIAGNVEDFMKIKFKMHHNCVYLVYFD